MQQPYFANRVDPIIWLIATVGYAAIVAVWHGLHRAWHGARDVFAIFQDRTPWGAWLRVAFDREPTLPLPIVSEQPDVADPQVTDPETGNDVFYADPIYDD